MLLPGPPPASANAAGPTATANAHTANTIAPRRLILVMDPPPKPMIPGPPSERAGLSGEYPTRRHECPLLQSSSVARPARVRGQCEAGSRFLDRQRPDPCQVERCAVKTLEDPAGRALDLSKITKTTVSALRGKPVQRGPGGSRGSGVESTFYEVRASLVEAKLEDDDDIHLVIRGVTTSGTMIVEFPTVACSSNATTGPRRA